LASSTRNIRSNTNQASHWLVFFLACALLGLAPILRGGNRQIALVGLLLLSALLLAVLLGSVSFDRLFGSAGKPAERRETRRAGMPLWSALLLLFVASSPLWLGLLRLVPLSAGAGAAWRGGAYTLMP
jgi:hypothetical protein